MREYKAFKMCREKIELKLKQIVLLSCTENDLNFYCHAFDLKI
jgi:hypothetical protein